MSRNRRIAMMVAPIALLLLSACGGSDGGSVVSTPAPSPAPSPTPSPTPPPSPAANDTSVELLAAPATQELAVATRDDPIRIRYDASRNVYEVKAGSFDWSAVVDPPDPHNPATDGPNRFFRIAGQDNQSLFSIQAHNRSSDPDRRYLYSNMANWGGAGADYGEWGNVVAFGAATPAAGVPTSGTASFLGFAAGTADLQNNSWGEVQTTPVGGPVRLQFDFGAGTLGGSLSLSSYCDCERSFDLGTITFRDTIFARGSQTFSGAFATPVAGANMFEGRFTGPRAEELIGSWALPFMFEGAAHQAWGAWIAKRGN